jgi:hypothetical protein
MIVYQNGTSVAMRFGLNETGRFRFRRTSSDYGGIESFAGGVRETNDRDSK